MIYRALFKILPDQRPISPFEQLHASLERMERIPALDQLAQLLTGNGLVVEPTEPLLNEKQRKKNPAELAWALTRNAHLASGKAVPLGLNQVSRIPESLDRILTLVKEDVRLDADSSWETIRIASPDRVYQFQIQQGGSEGMFKDEQLCDLVNHILQRQGVRNRLVCVSGPDSNDYVFYGSPKLFRKLHEEFGVNFQEGSEQYVEAANGQANLLAK